MWLKLTAVGIWGVFTFQSLAGVAAAAEPPPTELARWLQQLGSDSYREREEASKKFEPSA